MQVKEVEIGGVFALDKYENVRVVIRAAVSDEEFGKAVDWLCDTAEKVADIARAVRRWKDAEEMANGRVLRYLRAAREHREDAEEMRKKLREEAAALVKNLNLELLPPEVRKKIEEDPINVFTCGVAVSTCVRLDSIEQHLSEAERLEKEAEELKKKLKHYSEVYNNMRQLVKENRIDEAWALAKEVLKFYEELRGATGAEW
jgi:hypothetical protein